MNKRTSQHFGKTFATFGAKLAACALSLPFYTVGTIGGSVALTEPVYAQSTCTGGHWNCVTYFKGKWQNQSTPNVSATVQISDFRFQEPISGYPVTSSGTVQKDTNTVAITIPGGTTGAPSSIDINIRPNNNLVWDAAHGGFKLAPGAGGTNTQHVVIKFSMATTEGSCAQARAVGSGGVTIQGRAQNRSTIAYGIRVCMQAVIISQPPGNITLPSRDIFGLTFGGVAVGNIAISGTPQSIIIPPKPPAPKTCTSVNGTSRTLALDKIAVDELNNNAKRNPKNDSFSLLNCPANVRLKLTLEDVNKTTSTDDYLVNSLNDASAASGAGIQLIFGNETTPKSMKTPWEIRGANTANATNPINYSARYHHIAGSNLRPGKINSAAKLTIEYP